MGVMKKFIFLAYLILAVVFVTSCSSSNKVDVEAKWKTHSTDAYEFDYPNSWIVGVPKEIGMNIEIFPEFAICAPDVSEEKDFAANVKIVVHSFASLAPSAKEQADAVVDILELLGRKSGIKDYKQIAFTTRKIGNTEAGISTNEYIIAQNNIAVKSQQLIVPQGQKSYMLILTCKKDEWAAYEADFKKIIDSFSLK